MTILGIDISHHQGAPDFGLVAASGHVFVVQKATEGTGYYDVSLPRNRAAAHLAGMVVGFYHYAGASGVGTVGDPVAEARWFVDHVAPLQVGEFLVLDWEPRTPPANPPAWALTWLQTVESLTGVKPLVYLNQSAMNGWDWSPVVAGNYGLWLARYDNSTAQPAVTHWPAAAMKQFSDSGVVLGVPGGVDVNVFYGTAAQLRLYGKQPTPPPDPTPPTPPVPPIPVEDDMPALLVHNDGDKTVCTLDSRGYRPLHDPRTINVLAAAGYRSVTISQAEHENWLAQGAAPTQP